MSCEQVNVSRFELLMDAGFGAQKAGDILIKAFAHTGKNVFIEPMIPSEITPPARTRPALSGTIIRVANFDLKNIGHDTKLILASHEIVLDRRLDDGEFNPNCKILLDMGDKARNEESYENVCKRVAKLGLTIYPFEVTEEAAAAIKGLGGKGRNMYYLGMLSYIYNMSEEVMITEIKATFGAKLKEDVLNKNIKLFTSGYQSAKDNTDFSYEVKGAAKNNHEKILIDGNTALAMGIIDAGFKLFSGYPITPATSIMHSLASIFPSYGGIVHQAEDEISAIGTAIGAYFGGVPSITATSGPGLSLKQEFIGYAAASEIPLVVVDVQRSGPSTGMPTKTEQSDMPAVIFGSHGDHTKIVISVGNIVDCFYAPQLARYLTEKLRLPVFIMSDFQMANSYKVLEKPKINAMENANGIEDFVLNHFSLNRLPDDIEMVSDLQDDPGTPEKMHRVTGLNTDASGSVNYFAKTNQRSHAIRNEKVHHVQRALKHPEMFGSVTEGGDILVIGWGTTRGAIAEAVHSCQDQGLAVGGICFRIVYPLPLMLKEIFSKFKKVVTVELAYGDYMKRTPLAMFLRSKTLVDVNPIVSRATGRPISPMTIENAIKEELKDG
ncbi:2-oxoglutarate/2-oxoacid ferredoxin oxidoreductase, gamma subunit / 2-oxoglutarate/2-oxoacid ferredoxin oxidoreductase, alpha subunit [hydrothermal vent metagenome]|uniref:2-oxoglutarate/2-oxoacid ferredoxin oxidoreductase, gamma subunit / 2-oxoglutarate/2-oxoacid ferredoxin oxidoreductase, alpha subunit n=1 Tax=hydrothermal vent metagenome TaxID=652676 RepID=A0A3B1DJZ1_9ZZZZ